MGTWIHTLSERFLQLRWSKMRKEQGQALVELALGLPLLVLLLLGAVEFALATFASIEVSNAASAAVQYGGQNTTTAADTAGIQTAASNDAPDITLGTTTVSLSCICSDGSASTCAVGDCSTSNIEKVLTVQTQSVFDPGIHLPGLSTTYTLRGRAVRKIIQ